MDFENSCFDPKEVAAKCVTLLLILSIIILTVTVSIGLPIYVRPFYYAHIEALDMPYWTGLSVETIKEAYD